MQYWATETTAHTGPITYDQVDDLIDSFGQWVCISHDDDTGRTTASTPVHAISMADAVERAQRLMHDALHRAAISASITSICVRTRADLLTDLRACGDMPDWTEEMFAEGTELANEILTHRIFSGPAFILEADEPDALLGRVAGAPHADALDG